LQDHNVPVANLNRTLFIAHPSGAASRRMRLRWANRRAPDHVPTPGGTGSARSVSFPSDGRRGGRPSRVYLLPHLRPDRCPDRLSRSLSRSSSLSHRRSDHGRRDRRRERWTIAIFPTR